MISRILCFGFIIQSLLAAQAPSATEPASTTAPAVTESAVTVPAVTVPAVTVPTADETLPLTTPAVVTETAIIGPLADGSVSLPAPVPPLPNFKIKSTTSSKIIREEPSGVPGLPPLRKRVTATVHLVEDPHLSATPPPLPPVDMSDPEALARRIALAAHDKKTKFVFLSATVYDHQRTLLIWNPIGAPATVMTAWSNIDFNYMSGFTSYTYKGCTYSLLLMLGNEFTIVRERAAQRTGRPYIRPVFPVLPTDAPGFVVTQGDTGDAQAMDVISGLHELYKVEGTRLKAAYEARAKASIEREAYLRANPPQPKDVTIHVWKMETPPNQIQPAANVNNHQGGNP